MGMSDALFQRVSAALAGQQARLPFYFCVGKVLEFCYKIVTKILHKFHVFTSTGCIIYNRIR